MERKQTKRSPLITIRENPDGTFALRDAEFFVDSEGKLIKNKRSELEHCERQIKLLELFHQLYYEFEDELLMMLKQSDARISNCEFKRSVSVFKM